MSHLENLTTVQAKLNQLDGLIALLRAGIDEDNELIATPAVMANTLWAAQDLVAQAQAAANGLTAN